jgi:hypothetical protein
MKDEDITTLLTGVGVALDDWFIVGGTPAHPSDIGVHGHSPTHRHPRFFPCINARIDYPYR